MFGKIGHQATPPPFGWLGHPLADPIVGLLIAAAILMIVWQSGKVVFTRLLDASRESIMLLLAFRRSTFVE